MYSTLIGTLTYWFDSSGILLWLFIEDNPNGLENIHLLCDGDHLTVFDEQDEILFCDYIETDTTVGAFIDATGKSIGSPYALGFKVKWIQRGWQAHDWARLFVRYHQEGELPRRAELIKRVVH
ncbi:hypothetical protein KKC47_03250 [Patescibacteria group bacterium]|nr:hypothetical protein [Patescibacteria group bacterium]